MPGGAAAVRNGHDLREAVVTIGECLGLQARTEVRVGRRLWGAQRCIDVVLTQTEARRALGIECKFQGVTGTAEEKLPATVQDISAWPIAGLVVFAGEGFSSNMRSYLYSTGKAVDLDDLESWLRLFFGIAESDVQRSL
jgi:hypothetical protein